MTVVEFFAVWFAAAVAVSLWCGGFLADLETRP